VFHLTVAESVKELTALRADAAHPFAFRAPFHDSDGTIGDYVQAHCAAAAEGLEQLVRGIDGAAAAPASSAASASPVYASARSAVKEHEQLLRSVLCHTSLLKAALGKRARLKRGRAKDEGEEDDDEADGEDEENTEDEGGDSERDGQGAAGKRAKMSSTGTGTDADV
jgi:hypothetical protein